jgi:hypothetical protein
MAFSDMSPFPAAIAADPENGPNGRSFVLYMRYTIKRRSAIFF